MLDECAEMHSLALSLSLSLSLFHTTRTHTHPLVGPWWRGEEVLLDEGPCSCMAQDVVHSVWHI
jgi:hypothetical protein